MRWFFPILILFVLSGCGGFCGGIASIPYVGDIEPQQLSIERPWSHEVTLPGLTVHLSLNNTVRTYQYEVMLYIIPTYLNFWDEFWSPSAEALEVSLQVTSQDMSVTLDPRQLILTVDSQEIRPTGVWVNNLKRERDVIDAYVIARRQAPPDQPPPTPQRSEWRDAVTDSVPIRLGERSPTFIITFPLPLLSPERDFALNINPAIVEPLRSDRPLIRFKAMRWSEGYS